ncbi:MAG: hypothetical protein M3Q03_08750, partial [Chloroflexota bacterium]|nr:hypothetical protein [Chloroflexota bacterium]
CTSGAARHRPLDARSESAVRLSRPWVNLHTLTSRSEPYISSDEVLPRGLVATIERLQALLDAAATAATREWRGRYLTEAVSFRGVKMGDIRRTVRAWCEDERLGERLNIGQQKGLPCSCSKRTTPTTNWPAS